ncbi:hypothetical protein JW911_00230 [Candidatus Peregrinibacteria bacterium]|nr:hypothetical protein [Candidatus Peregrinibacteria bacterium]
MDILLILMVVFCLLISLTAFVSIFYRVPYVPTSRRVIDKIFSTIKLKKGNKFVDLGCGDGRMLQEAEKRAKADGTGYEIAPLVYLMALCKKIVSGSKYKIHYKNFFKDKLDYADVIFCYLMPFQLKKLSNKIQKECKKGTVIVSNTFKIEGMRPKKIIPKNIPEKTPSLYIYQI